MEDRQRVKRRCLFTQYAFVPVMSGLRVESRPASATAAGAFPASGSAASAFLRFEISARGFLSVKQCLHTLHTCLSHESKFPNC